MFIDFTVNVNTYYNCLLGPVEEQPWLNRLPFTLCKLINK